MYYLSPILGAVYCSNENVRFILVFLAYLNLLVSLVLPMLLFINFCFYFRVSVCCCFSLCTPFLSCLLEVKLLSLVCSNDIKKKVE